MVLGKNNIAVLTRRNGENEETGYTLEFRGQKAVCVGICIWQKYSSYMLLWDGYIRNT